MSSRAQQRNLRQSFARTCRDCFLAALLAMTALAGLSPASRGAEQHCVRADIVLWGDGKHDDTTALGAWFGGADAVWAATGEPVGVAIAGHSFRLSDAVYVPAGTGRRLE